MPRDGSGTYTRAVSSYVNGTVANATTVNTEMDDIASALTGSLPVNGVKAMAANLPMGGFKLTGLAAGTTNGDSVRYEQLTALSGTYQPLDGDLTAIAALSNGVPERTGPDTWAARTDVVRSSQTYTISASWTFSASPILANNIALQARESGGTARATIIVDGSNVMIFGDANLNGRYRNFEHSWDSGGVTGRMTLDSAGLLTLANNMNVGGTLRARPRALTTTTGTLVVADANCAGTLTGGVTLPNSVFSAGDMQVFDAGTSARTLTRGAGIQMFLNGTDVASATLAANQTCGVFWRSASVAVLSGGVS